jgi:chromosome segregation ATPase
MSTRLNNRIRETEDEIAKAMERRNDLLDRLVRIQSRLNGLIRDHRRLRNRRRKTQEVEQEASAAPDELNDDLGDLIQGPRSNRSTTMSPEHRRRLHPYHLIKTGEWTTP